MAINYGKRQLFGSWLHSFRCNLFRIKKLPSRNQYSKLRRHQRTRRLQKRVPLKLNAKGYKIYGFHHPWAVRKINPKHKKNLLSARCLPRTSRSWHRQANIQKPRWLIINIYWSNYKRDIWIMLWGGVSLELKIRKYISELWRMQGRYRWVLSLHFARSLLTFWFWGFWSWHYALG